MTIQHAVASFVVADDWFIAGLLSDEYGTPLDPHGATAIKWRLDNETGLTNYITLQLGTGISFSTVPNWPVPVVAVSVPAAATQLLVPGTYRDQLRLILDGQSSVFWYGPIQVIQEI